MFSPNKIWRKWHRQTNLNERRVAVVAALAASAVPALVVARGHRIGKLEEVPLVLSSNVESIKKTKHAVEILKRHNANLDIDRAVDSRKIRTGELQTSGGNADTMKAGICAEMAWLAGSCASKLNLDVRTFTSFADQSTPPDPVADGAVTPTNFCFDPGGAGSIVLVRAYYTWKLILPVLNAGLRTVGAGDNPASENRSTSSCGTASRPGSIQPSVEAR